jgi:DnaK suppressor protein
MNTDRYQQRLLAQERELIARIAGAVASAREPRNEQAGDAADESVTDNRKEEPVREADADSTLLNQVREALTRLDNGTYGQCVVDGQPIEESRLDAVPWTPYCLKHQERTEKGSDRTPTL